MSLRPPSRRRWHLRLLIVGAGASLPIGAAVGPYAAAGASSTKLPSASTLLKDAEGAASRAGTMSFSDNSTAGKVTQSLVGTLSAPTAAESLSTSGQVDLQVELVGTIIYVRAGSQVLEGPLGLPAAAATANAGKWISVQPTDSAFSTLSAQLTLASELDTYVPVSDLHMGKEVTLAKQKAVPISGRPSSTAAQGAKSGSVALFVSVKAPYLPIGGSLVLAKKGSPELKEVAVFGNWGKKVAVTAPTGAVGYSSLLG
jgi:hypothetical protein